MKVITHYICEICHSSYLKEEEARKCELKGKPDTAKYPVGMIYNNAANPKVFYKKITLAIARQNLYGHAYYPLSWAAHDNGCGDSFDKEVCGSGNSLYLDKKDIPNPGHPTFQRMVKFLKTVPGLTITCWDGSKAIPLHTFLRNYKKAPK